MSRLRNSFTLFATELGRHANGPSQCAAGLWPKAVKWSSSLSSLLAILLLSVPASAQLLLRVGAPKATYGVVSWQAGVVILSEAGARYRPIKQQKEVGSASADSKKAKWLVADEGVRAAYTLKDGSLLLLTEDSGRRFASLDAEPETVLSPSDAGKILGTSETARALWVATQKGLFAVSSDGAVELRAKVFGVRAVADSGVGVYFAAGNQVFKLDDKGTYHLIGDLPVRVGRLVATSQYLWVLTELGFGRRGPAFGLELEVPEGRSKLSQLPGPSEVLDVAEVGSEVWLATLDGVRLSDGGIPSLVEACPDLGRVNAIVPDPTPGNTVWVASTQRAYRIGSQGCMALPPEGRALNFTRFRRLESGLWGWGSDGAFLYYPEGRIRAKLDAWEVFGHYLALGSRVRLVDPFYEFGTGSGLGKRAPDRTFVEFAAPGGSGPSATVPIDAKAAAFKIEVYSTLKVTMLDSLGNASLQSFRVSSVNWFLVAACFLLFEVSASRRGWRFSGTSVLRRMMARLLHAALDPASRRAQRSLANFDGYVEWCVVAPGSRASQDSGFHFEVPHGAELKVTTRITTAPSEGGLVERVVISGGSEEEWVEFDVLVERPNTSSGEKIIVRSGQADQQVTSDLGRVEVEPGTEFPVRFKLLQKRRFLLGRRVWVRVLPPAAAPESEEGSSREA